ncbi:hypothetical protein WKK05_12440 [Nostoc sp. UHCC 0302]
MSNKHIEVKPIAGFIGAKISGVNLSRLCTIKQLLKFVKHF